ncbi:hypothetical protein SADUNF_Sadunf16G0134100 [Salix dunnii]|uniref:Uncharacterized protein n=1 Tax=Salix dunnii TaxID=1413687 RepID=A0A835JE43_9ROSI|nr:hypothetical protein SADUNF_Sadunf16G0134100 [Salix dunnii]
MEQFFGFISTSDITPIADVMVIGPNKDVKLVMSFKVLLHMMPHPQYYNLSYVEHPYLDDD